MRQTGNEFKVSSMTNRTSYLILFVALLPILLFRDYTPSNELRYLSIADEALRQHTFFSFTNHGLPYADKPPLYLWGVMLGKTLFGTHNMLFLSLFSLLPAFGIVEVMDRWMRSELAEDLRQTARRLLLTCGLFLGMLVTLRMDMLMCLFITLALYTFHRMETGSLPYPRGRWLFPLYVFLAVFSKGPIGLLVPLLSTVVFLLWVRRPRHISRYWGWSTWLVLLAGCGLWFGAVYAEGGEAYLNNLLFHQTVDRAVNAFHHERPFYYYALAVWYALLPWSLLLIGLPARVWRRSGAHTDSQRLFLTTIVVTFVMLSCISSKIEVYLLPIYPFLVYLTATFLPGRETGRAVRMAIGLPLLPFAGALPALWLLRGREEAALVQSAVFYVAAGALTVGTLTALWQLVRQQTLPAIRTFVAGLFAALFIGGWGVPDLNAAIGYGELCRAARQMAVEYGTENYYTWDLPRTENMDVYLHRDVEILDKTVPPPATLKEGLLLTRARYLKFYPDRPARRVGDYAVVRL